MYILHPHLVEALVLDRRNSLRTSGPHRTRVLRPNNVFVRTPKRERRPSKDAAQPVARQNAN